MERLFVTTEFISLFAFVIMVYLAAIAMVFYRRAHLKNKAYEKKKYTYEFCLERHAVLNKMIDEVTTHRKITNNDYPEPYEKRVIEIFNEISIGVNHDLLDENIVRPMFEGVFISFFREKKFFMYSTGERLNNPYLFNEFQILTEKWEREPMGTKRFSR